jgi:diaminopropionate ammonia-lyase
VSAGDILAPFTKGNPVVHRRDRVVETYPNDLLAIAGGEAGARARGHITRWPGHAPTPLRQLPGLTAAAGLADIAYKDEGPRFGLGSFKALGGPYAVQRLLSRMIGGDEADLGVDDLTGPAARDQAATVTVCCATAGNHGCAVAWAARTFGCRCVIYIAEAVSPGRADAMAALGAKIVRVSGLYEDSLAQVNADAATNGWHVISDTAGLDFGPVQCDILNGYTQLPAEFLDQWGEGPLPTHVFAQGGVGGLCAGVLVGLWEALGGERPCFVVVEPEAEAAACLYLSAVNKAASVFPGDCASVMACLACAEVNEPAWRILDRGADAFMTIADEAAVAGMRLLADSVGDDGPVVAGESGVAALAGVLAAMGDAAAREVLELDGDSRVLVIGSEGATDPDLYEQITGRRPETVLTGS